MHIRIFSLLRINFSECTMDFFWMHNGYIPIDFAVRHSFVYVLTLAFICGWRGRRRWRKGSEGRGGWYSKLTVKLLHRFWYPVATNVSCKSSFSIQLITAQPLNKLCWYTFLLGFQLLPKGGSNIFEFLCKLLQSKSCQLKSWNNLWLWNFNHNVQEDTIKKAA